MKIMIMAGGTGGHVYPALAVARVLKSNGHEVFWLGSVGGMENKIVAANGIHMENINIKGLRGNGILSWLKAPFKLVSSLIQSINIIKKHQPDSVLGMGGFVTGPGGLAARLSGVPIVLHEQNATVGLTNKLLQPISNKVLQAFPNSFKGENITTVGNPVRKDIEDIVTKTKINNPLHILVIGGSLGAQIFNEIIPELMAEIGSKITVCHQTGANKLESTKTRYAELNVDDSQVVEFIEDMSGAYLWADLVICRSGAMSIFELAAAGKPAILVPYPHAVDNHQWFNAQFLVESGAAKIVDQKDLSVDYLVGEIDIWLNNPELLMSMAAKSKQCYEPNSAQIVADFCVEVADERI